MASRHFALPLDENSHQSGEITFKSLAGNQLAATFQLTNAGCVAVSPRLNLITKGHSQNDHVFSGVINDGEASVELSPSDLNDVYGDASGGAWDYIEADWIVEEVDTPDKSEMAIIQSGRTYDLVGWPPK